MDGDPAAAMRYTEARMAGIADEMLLDMEKETVDYAQTLTAPDKSRYFCLHFYRTFC